MQGNDVALLEECVLRVNRVHPGLLYRVLGAERVVGVNVHAEALGYARHVAPHVAEGQYAELLAHQLGAGLAVIEIAHGVHQQAEHELGHGV